MADMKRTGSSQHFSRREVLGMTGAAALAGVAGRATASEKRPRVACVITEYWDLSHADWIVQKLLDGYWWQGAHTPSRVDVVSMFVHQFPDNDLSRKVCAKYNIPMFSRVSDALTLSGKNLAVDGVVLIGEHGKYHTNLKGQTYYPRWWLYQQIMRVFTQSRRSAPVFNDKHLSTDWNEAKWMYDRSREMGFPLMAGSSLPVCHRDPQLELDLETPLTAAVVTSNGGKEAYGFHALEVLQCMAERRKGGETGVAAIQCIEGPETWTWTDRNPWAGRLLDEALARCPDKQPGNVRDNVRQPFVFIIEYRDGTRAAVYTLNGHGLRWWALAGDIAGRKEPASTHFWFNYTQGKYLGSSSFVHYINEMMVTGKEPYPAERTLLTTGMLSYLMDSNWENGRHTDIGRRLETPYFDMKYKAGREQLYDRGARPPDIPLVRGF
ncbi:MAG: hypothetical protein Q8O92_05975 [Candidatus Latescibacter sp.]|nr:hypothetical protein [Candidatus Latescibacter sp.]